MTTVITCAGYYRTGSSVISDFFSEFDDCVSLGDYEIRFLQDPNGIADLEYNLVENNHRHNTSHAIKKYLKLVHFLNGTWYAPRYRKIFGNLWLKYSYTYVNKLAPFQARAWWHMDQIEHGRIFYDIDRIYGKIAGAINPDHSNISLLKNEISYYSYVSKDKFYEYTKDYIRNLLSSINENNCNYIVVDQLVPPSNIHRYLNYVDSMKVIVVDRDPRDLYALEKMKYQWGIIPYKNVVDFCKWYKIVREHRKTEHDNPLYVLRINFEDMIYNYDNIRTILCDFVGISKGKQLNCYKFFDPAKSRKNTYVYRQYPQLASDIDYIEKELQDYLYLN